MWRASKQVGMIYRTFYQYPSQLTLLKMDLAHVQPLLVYASQLWDTPAPGGSSWLFGEGAKVWFTYVMQAMEKWLWEPVGMGWPSFTKTCWSIAKLCYLNKMLCGVIYALIFPLPSPGIWTPDFELFKIPCSFSRLQGLTLVSFLLPYLNYIMESFTSLGVWQS